MINLNLLKEGAVVLYQAPNCQIIKARVNTNGQRDEILVLDDILGGRSFAVSYDKAITNIKKVL
jgi:hypothetical protein